MTLEALVGPVVESAGLELVEVAFRNEGGRRVLRVTVDREGGVDLDTISRVSEAISRRLDLEDAIAGAYALEVSSPGVERPLKVPEGLERRVGELVRLKTSAPVEGSRTHTGSIVSVDEGDVVLSTEQGERRLRLEDVSAARTVFDWNAGKGSKK
ncbi:MAG: ribosome maturation factor RimP [Actinomycetota bacterium]